MKYEEMISNLEDVRKKTEDKYIDEVSEHIFNGISKFGFVDLITENGRKDIRPHDWSGSYDILLPQEVFYMIRRKLSEHFCIINIRCEVYRLTLK